MTEEDAKQCLKWAQEYCHWTRKDWEMIIWSDECALQKDSDHQDIWITRHQNKREKYDPKNVQGQTRWRYVTDIGMFSGK